MWLPLTHAPLGAWPTWPQAYALTGNRTSDSLVCRLTLNPLSHTSQGWNFFNNKLPSPLPKTKIVNSASVSAFFFEVDRYVPLYKLEPLEFKVPSLLLPLEQGTSVVWTHGVGVEASGPP